MKTNFLTLTVQQLTSRTTHNTPGTHTGTGLTQPPKHNHLRTGAARLLISLVLLLVMQGMAGFINVNAANEPTTRLYLQNANSTVTTTNTGTWSSASSVPTLVMSKTKAGSITSRSVSETSSTNNYTVLVLKFVSDPIPAQTIAAGTTLNWVLGVLESDNRANDAYRVHAYVVSGDGSILRGTLLSNSNESTEWPTSATGFGISSAKTLNTVTAQANDRVVIEIGYIAGNTRTDSYSGRLWYGGTGSDLTVGGDETSRTGWFEFEPGLYQLPVPTITSFDSSIGCEGSSLVITGTNLTGATAVTIGGTAATITDNTETTVTVTVGSGTTGVVEVTTPGGTATSGATTFTVNLLPAAVSVGGGGSACNSATLTATGGSGGTIYFQGTTSGGESTANPSSSQVVTESGTYYFRAQTAAGCWGPEGSETVTITNSPTTSGETICQGGSSVTGLTSTTVCPAGGSENTGAINAGTGANVTGIGTVAWSSTTLGNINADDNNYATVSLNNATSNYLQATGYGFNIPTDAIISGIAVTVGRFDNGTFDRDNSINLVKNGTIIGSNLLNGITNSYITDNTLTPVTFGSSNEQWGISWTAADINSNNFGACYSVTNTNYNNRTISVDYMQITVYYTTPGSIKWYTVSSGGTAVQTGSSFFPVGDPEVIAQGGIYANLSDSNTPNTYTFYAECSTSPDCRTATQFIINEAPAGSLTNNGPVCAGTNADLTFTSTAGTGPFDLVINGTTYPGIVSGGTVSVSPSAPSTTYTLTSITDKGVTPNCQQTVSAATTVTVNTAPAISSPPSNSSITYGADATFAVGATGTGLSYQWQVSTGGAFTDLSNGGVYSNVLTSSLNITKPPVSMSGYQYRCVVSGTCPTAVTSAAASLTVNKKAASVTPNAAGKEYGGTDPALTGSLSGFLPADNVTATYSRIAGETVGASPYTISATLSPAGVLGNYEITYNTAAFTITKKAASVTPNAAGKEYGGTDPALTGTLAGFLPADAVTASYSRIPGETVGASPYTISATLSPAGVLGNYEITYNTAAFTITKKAASVTPNAAGKEYGAADPALTGSVSGFLPADNVTATYSRIAGETVLGSPYIISATLNPAAVLGNYNITYNTASFNISKASSTIEVNDVNSYIYNGWAQGPTTTVVTGGSTAPVTFEYSGTGSTTYPASATKPTNAGTYQVVATLAADDNHEGAVSAAFGFSITKKTITVTPDAGQTKEYGAANPAYTYGFTPALISGDSFSGALSRVAGEDVASYDITQGDLALSANYTLTFVENVKFAITKKAASVTPIANSKVYGAIDPALAGNLAGFLPADNVTAAYSRTAGETVLGGPYTISAVLSPAGVLANYTITYNTAAFTITTKTASVVVDAQTKEYGASDPTLTGTLSGFMPADNVIATYSRIAGETVLGGPYTISAVLTPTEVLSNYDITNTPASLTITKKAASVTPIANSKVYGAIDPALAGNLVGFLTADNVTAAYSRTAGETVLGGPYTISAVLSPAGVLANYTITYNTAAFTITTKTASVVVDAQTKEYGASDPTLTGTLSGFMPADNVIATYSRIAGETVLGGPYTISAVLTPTEVLSNYDITNTPASLTITKKTASVTPIANSKVYGAIDPALAGNLAGFLTADNVTAIYSRTAGETVLGGPYTISAVLSPAGVLANYTITYNTAAFTITTKTASVVVDAQTKEYGASDPTLTGTLSGFMPADNVIATYSRIAGETVLGGPYTISAVLTPTEVLSNYDITNTPNSLTITKKAASVTPIANSKVYGAIDPALAGNLVGFLTADNVTAIYSRTAGETVLGGPYTISAVLSPAGVLANYTITYNTAAFTITTKTASVVVDAQTKEYGASDPTLTGTLSGFMPADNVIATYSRIAGETVLGGPYTISAVLTPTEVLSNYDITNTPASLTITKKAASVTPIANSKVYGAIDPALAGNLVGFLTADNVTAAYSRAAGETVLGGPYTISAVLSPAGVLANYTITYNTAAFTITTKTASVVVDAQTKEYGASDPTLTGTLSGFMPADNVIATYSRIAGETVLGGPYTISAVLTPTEVLSNYDITNTPASLTITKKAASVTPIANSKVYGAIDPALAGNLVGFLTADNVTAAYSRAAGETVLGGPYTISAVLSPAGVLANYTITYNTAAFTITTKTASVVVDAQTKEYGASDPTLTGTLSGFMPADNVIATYSRIAGETVLGGPYTISAVLTPTEVLSNYDITNTPASLTITKKTASVTPIANSKVYGAIDPALAGNLAGFLTADNVTAIYSRTAGETVLGGPYTISAVLSPAGVLANYTITYNTAAFTITTKTASVVVDAQTKEYGASDPTLTGTLSGFMPADNVIATYSRIAGETVLGGPYTISAVLTPTEVLSNYDITNTPASLTITKKAASVTPIANSKVYGAIDPALAGNLVGFLTADNVTAAYSRAAGETVLGGPYTISAVLSPAGVLANYTITYNTAAFTITTKTASVVVDAQTKEYGASDPTLTGTLSGFMPADNVIATYSRIAGETVLGGPYTISAVLTPTEVLSNYDITNTPNSLTITKKTASVTPIANSKVYGAIDPALAGNLVGFLTADNVTAIYSRTAGETVLGGPYTISAVLSPAGVLANYTITYNTAAFTITTKTASVVVDAQTKEYGASDPTLTGTLSGFMPADNVIATYSRIAGETVLGGPYTISAVLTPTEVLSNYDITNTPASLTITKKAASVTPIANSKVYGAIDPALAGNLVGFLTADNVTAAYSRAAGETVLGGPYTISAVLSPAGVLANYTITYNTAAFTITTKTASVVVDAQTKEYGASDPTLTGTLSGFMPADNVIATYSRIAGETVLGGPYTISAVLTPTEVLSNYDITNTPNSLTITKKAASVTPIANSKVYGAIDPALAGNLVGFLTADNVTAIYSRTAGETVLGGPYTISAVLSPAGVLANYTITYNTAAFTITTKTASVVVDAQTKEYGASDPTLTGTLSGFMPADNVIATYSRIAGETVLGGPYTISAVLTPTEVLSNYDITNTPASLTITKKTLTVTASDITKEFNTTYTFLGTEFTTVGLVPGDIVTSATITSDGAAQAAVVGDHDILIKDAVGDGLANYEIGYVKGTMHILDRTAPSTVCKAVTIDLNASGAATLTAAQIDGGTIDPSSFTLEISKSSFDCSEVGNHNVTLTATDIYGNTSSCEAVVTVQDKVKPVVTCPSNKVFAAECTAINIPLADIGTATATDNCTVLSVTGSRQGGLALTDPYPIGVNIITWSATDVNGNVAVSCDQTITVNGNITVTLTGTTPVNVNNTPGACSALVPEEQLKPTVTGCGAYTLQRYRGDYLSLTAPYPVGNTTIYWTAWDNSVPRKQVAYFDQVVTVTDSENPTITAPGAVSVNNDTDACGAVVASLGTPVTHDNCAVATVTNDHASTTYPVGETTVTWTVTDIHGHSATATQVVTVVDAQNPVIVALPSDIVTNNDPGVCGAVVSWTAPTSNDNCAGSSIAQTAGPVSGSTFPIGTTTVTYTATDAANNTFAASFTVKVIDNQNPTIVALPSNIVTNNDTGVCGAVVTWTAPTADDNCAGSSIAQTAGLASGATFPIGTTTVTYTATDAANNTFAASFTVKVIDNQNPTIVALPSNIVTNNDTGVCGAVVTWTAPTADDNCAGSSIAQTAGLASGATFPIGTTTVTYTATDAANNTFAASFTVKVIDNQNPTIVALPSNIVTNNDPGVCGAVVTWTAPTADDNCAGSSIAQTAGLASGATFPIGTTTVTYTATDAANNTFAASFTVKVIDNQNPTIVALPSNIVTNNDTGVCGAVVTWTAPTADDNCAGSSIAQTAGLASGATFPIGTTTVTYTATDAANNTFAASFTVKVIDNQNPTIVALLPTS